MLVEAFVRVDLGVLVAEGVDLGVLVASHANRCGSGIIDILTAARAFVEAAVGTAAVMSEGQCM